MFPSAPFDHRTDVVLAPLTTLDVGGPASMLAEPFDESELAQVVRWADEGGVPRVVIGGGSNVVVSDDGFEGLVIRPTDYRFEVERAGADVLVTAGAGVEWDELVAFAVAEGFAGVECLSGIPGCVGAAPIQNIGAYGREVGEVVDSVRLVLCGGGIAQVRGTECGFGYRQSRFKQDWSDGRVVSSVTFRLRRGAPATVRYAELAAALGVREGGPAPTLAATRDAVISIRARKSMVLAPEDPNRRSCGSFFVNPVVADELASDLVGRFGADMPRWDAEGGVKLSAAWLIERAGFERGFAFGRAGLSSRHTLALINRGGARAADVLGLARIVRSRVLAELGVTLRPEPVFIGFGRTGEELLQ